MPDDAPGPFDPPPLRLHLRRVIPGEPHCHLISTQYSTTVTCGASAGGKISEAIQVVFIICIARDIARDASVNKTILII